MSSSRWQLIKEIVDAALDRPPAERSRYLDEVCTDPKLRKEVDSLLSHETVDFLEEPAAVSLDVSGERSEPPGPAESPRDAGAPGHLGILDTSGPTVISGEPEEAPPEPEDLEGRVFGQYRIESQLGSGGMGEVFLAHDRALDRRVALKLLAADLQADDVARQRFLREAKSAAALDHPYICKIFEIGEADGRSFIAMEHIVGETLGDRIVEVGGGLPLSDVHRIASEIADALATAHSRDIVHRDLKPANIMLTVGGHVKVLDFGLAKRIVTDEGPGQWETASTLTRPRAEATTSDQFETASRLTGTGMTLGTLAYMSPEQLRGQTLDSRSDIFSFGILLFEMLTGAHPFDAKTPMDTAAAILQAEPPPIGRFRKDAPAAWEAIVMKMLAKDPAERYQRVRGAGKDLERLGGPGVGLHSGAPGAAEGAAARPFWQTAASVAAVLVVLGALGTIWGISTGMFGFGAGPPSVAVLPLVNASGDLIDDPYAQGISRAVGARLARTGVRVTPWETARRYGGDAQPAAGVARALNVDAVVYGELRSVDDEMTVNVRTVDAETGFQSWADLIVEPFDNVQEVQTRIATGVASTLLGALTAEQEAVLATPESLDLDAYDSYLSGEAYLGEGTIEGIGIALDYFEQALTDDPDLAGASVGAGIVYAAQYDYGLEGGLGNLERAQDRLEAALEIDPGELRAVRTLCQLDFFRGDSAACLARAEALASAAGGGTIGVRAPPSYDPERLLTRGAVYAFGGFPDRAVPLLERAIELDPDNEEAHRYLVLAYGWLDAPERMIEVGGDYRTRFEDNLDVQTMVAQAYHMLGSTDRAGEEYRRARALATRATAQRAADPAGAALARAYLHAGFFLQETGERSRAAREWRRGRELAVQSLEANSDNVGVRLYLAMFHAMLGEEADFARERQAALEGAVRAGISPYQLQSLAATHVARGETGLAIEVLRGALAAGSINPIWKTYLRLAARARDGATAAGAAGNSPAAANRTADPLPEIPGLEGLAPFIEEFDAKVDELRRQFRE